jgi:arylsulfatase A-like enzyme
VSAPAGNASGAVRAAVLALAALAAAACREAPPPNVLLLVTVDTLRASELGAYGSERGLTPHLDALAAESVVFEAAYAAAPLTLPSLATLFTGRTPDALGLRSNESALPEAVPTLASDLRERGWRTGAVVSNFVLREGAGLARGFDLYDDDLPRREAVRSWPERSGRDATDAALGLLDMCPGQRCFVWVHYQEPHGPYEPPPERRARHLERERAAPDGARELPVGRDDAGEGAIPAYQFLGGRRDVAFYRAGYRGEVEAVDAEIGRLLAGLDARGLRERAVVVVTADHGESLGERGVFFAHGGDLGDAQVRVPLLVRAAGLAPARRADAASLADLRPTLLRRLAGVPPDPGLGGRDLLAPGAEAAASRAYFVTRATGGGRGYGLVEDGYKLIVTEAGGPPRIELFRLGREDADLAPADPERAAALGARLRALRAEGRAAHGDAQQALSEQDREHLRALGYGERTAPD